MSEARILIVEDEGIVAKDLSRTLEHLGYGVAGIAATGEDAIEIAEQTNPDLVLMDIVLRGDMDGIEAARRIREGVDTTIVFLTAYADDDKLSAAQLVEPFGYIIKPVQDQELRSNIEMALYKHKMERRLMQREQYYRALIENAPDGIIVVDEEGIVTFVSPSYKRLIHREPEELIGQSIFNIVAHDDQGWTHTMFAELLEMPGSSKRAEVHILHKDGSVRIFEAIGQNLLANPAVRGIVVNGHDVTEQRRTQQALARRRHALQTLHTVSLEINARIGEDDLMDYILGRAAELLKAEKGVSLLIYESEAGGLRLVKDTNDKDYIGIVIPIGEGMAGRVYETGKPMIVRNYDQWEGRFLELGSPENRTLMQVPLRRRDEVIGVLDFDTARPEGFDQDDVWLAELFAAQASVAMENGLLYQALEEINEDLEQIVTERTGQLRQAKDRLEAIIRSTPDVILLLNPDCIIERVNEAARDVLRYAPGELLGESPEHLMTEAGALAFHEAWASVSEGHPAHVEIVARRRDGALVDMDAVIAPMSDPAAGMVCSLRDIGSFKEIERMKDALLTNISQALRTPIMNMKVYISLLQRSERPERTDQYIDMLGKQADWLAQLLEDVLAMTHLINRDDVVVMKPVALSTILGDALIHYARQAGESGIMLKALAIPPDCPTVIGSDTRLSQAIAELIKNAIVYTPEGGTVTLGVRIEERDDPWVTITVRDDGPGIPPEEYGQLFDPFFRGEAARTADIPGTGLGLAIVKEIVEQHGGTVTVESAPGEGAAFTLWLPASPHLSE